MDKVLAFLRHPATALGAGIYLMAISFAWTFFGIAPGPLVIGSFLWVGGGMAVAAFFTLAERSEKR
ncbi:hypothetical protein [Pontivivens insulae]|uniref:Uncharacterized protein n=1 Tax=Pontivivens insulae TaxID=1639689 RepID=A0A2R8AB98_9RHOB|nr:hypothetical protein [Pontivivens insulae]RED11336.1 hypothetical protein DFR53_3371 [Pontivivens insulae]SPF29491.1 hypothetical protein POI8812_01802 [Pontivivens insulae]